MLERTLRDLVSGKTWKGDASREWDQLKKGLVFVSPVRKVGAPMLHRYLGRAYTGMLPIVGVAGGILCTVHESSHDVLLLIDPSGALKWKVKLGVRGGLVHELVAPAPIGPVFFNVDHGLWKLDLESRSVERRAPTMREPASLLDARGPHLVWRDDAAVGVFKLGSPKPHYRIRCEIQLYHEHSPQSSAALSSDGRWLALCTTLDTIEIHDVQACKLVGTIRGSFEFVEQLAFAGDGAWLVARTPYAKPEIRVFDVGKRVEAKNYAFVAKAAPNPAHLTVSPDGRALAVVTGVDHTVHVFDLVQRKRRVAFPLEHAVKTAHIAFVGDCVAARTDYGCASLYAL